MQNKKNICFLSFGVFLLLSVIVFSPHPVFAETEIWEDYEYAYNEEYEGIELVRYYGGETKVTLPESIEGIPVTVIGEEIFLEEEDPRYETSFMGNQNYKIKKVIVPQTVKVIKERAFIRCKKLKEAVLPEELQELGEQAFTGCSKLEKINFPKGLTMIPEEAFCGCGFKKIVFPKNVTCIGIGSFFGCDNLKKIIFPSDSELEEIKYDAFNQCSNLKEINLPGKLKIIEGEAFSGCRSLTKIVIPKKVVTIQLYAFNECEKLKSITFKGAVPRIGMSAFRKIHPHAVFRVPKKYKSQYKKKLKSRAWYQSTMCVR